MSDPLILKNLSLSLGATALLKEVNLCVEAGQITTLLGRSGAGKSTLLKAISGVSDPEIRVHGGLYLGDLDLSLLPAHRRRMGYVEQHAVLFPHLNVWQNLAFGLRGRNQAEIDAALEIAGLSGFRAADVATLSGGQAARVALMRTLLSKPRALLLDEPFAALDPDLRASLRTFVFDQVRAVGLPTLLVTHDLGDGQAAGGPTFSLENGRLEHKMQGHV